MCFNLQFFKKRAIYLLIFGAFLFVLIFFLLRGLSVEARRRVKVVPVSSVVGDISVSPIVFDSEAYYRTIIENNLFRPLGWTPPVPVEPYRLIGTILPRDDRTPPRAILETPAGKTTYIVSIGEQIDTATKVVSIESKTVVLERDGARRTLYLSIVF